MADLVVYGTPLSPFVRKVQVVLAEKRLDYELVPINAFDMPDWYKEISPLKRMPVLRDKRVGTEGIAGTIADSSAICGFLDRLAPAPALYPAAAFACGRALWIEEYCDTGLAEVAGMGIVRSVLVPAGKGEPPDMETARKTWNDRLPRFFNHLELMLGTETWFAGDALSIADIAAASQLVNLYAITGPPDPARWPALVAHLHRMLERPSFAANLKSTERIVRAMLPEKLDLAA